MGGKIREVPKYGFKVRLDHEFAEKWSQKLRPKFKQTIQMMPLAVRFVYIYKCTHIVDLIDCECS